MREKKKKIIFLSVGVLIFVVLSIFLTNKKADAKEEDLSFEDVSVKEVKKEEVKKKETFMVDIKGEVLTPGVYEIEDGGRVIDVINKAGGLSENADTSLINLSKKVSDAMVIVVYSKEEAKKLEDENGTQVQEKTTNDALIKNNEKQISEKQTSNSNQSSGPININTASKEQLETLTGIGASKADKIIKYREENGGFKNIEQLQEVSGIGEKLFAKVKDNITI